VTEELTKELTEELKRQRFTICGCRGRIVTTEDGKRHFELDCKSKEAREEMAALFEEEVILRVNPKVILEEIPPVAEPK